jgi:hypothetical protein
MLPRVIALLASLLALAGAARAETQVFQATFSFVGLVDPPPSDTAIGVATVNGSGGGSHLATIQLPGDLLSLHTTVAVTGGTLPLTAVKIDLTLDAGTFAGGGGGELTGVMPVPGVARLCVLLDCQLGFDVPLTANAPTPKGVGIGPPGIDVALGAFGSLALLGAPWGTGPAMVSTPAGGTALTGFAHGPLSGTSSTAEPQGELLMVTPVRVGAMLGGPEQVLPLWGVLQVKLLPEPEASAALVAGAALLALLGAHRTRRRTR